jgi:hypothetical protein
MGMFFMNCSPTNLLTYASSNPMNFSSRWTKKNKGTGGLPTRQRRMVNSSSGSARGIEGGGKDVD